MTAEQSLQLLPRQTDSQSLLAPANSPSPPSPPCLSPGPTEDDGAAEPGQVCLADYLRQEVFPVLAPPPFGNIRTDRLPCQRPVLLFTEENTNITVVGKIFKDDSISLDQAWKRVEREYHHLKLLQNRFSMMDGLDRVVTPYGKNRDFSALLVMQLAPGHMLDHYISEAATEGRHDDLMKRLTYLARFFAKLHRNSQTGMPVSPWLAQQYFGKIMVSLARGPLASHEKVKMEEYAYLWWNGDSLLTGDNEVIVHGDATPTNFLFHHDEVVGIDVEKMCQADRCWDLGFMAAELKHHFMWRIGDSWAAEPFIGHFLERYSAACASDSLFDGISRRLPLYMALGLMRIARNTWLDAQHRTSLLREAKRCLKYGLSPLTITGRW